MPCEHFEKVKKWFHRRILQYRFLNRVVRALLLRLLLKLCLSIFKIMRFFSPVKNKTGKRILIMVLGGMGDCLLFDPLFRRLKDKWQDIRVDVLTGGFEQMWALMAAVDNLIVFKPSKFKTPWAYIKLFRTIHRNQYDIVAEGIAFLPKRGIYPIFTSLVFEASCAPLRIGRINTGRLGSMQIREMGFIGREEMRKKKQSPPGNNNPYLTHVISIAPPERRQAHESAYILESLGVECYRKPDEPLLIADAPNDIWAENLLRSRWADQKDILIGMTLETTRQIKTWPLDYFSSIIENGIRDGFKYVLVGLDKAYAARAADNFPKEKILNLAGRTSLGQMIAIIRHCDFFLSGDTGPSHIAQACRVPTIVLFGPSNEKEFGPADSHLHTLIHPSAYLPCRPCVLGPCIRSRSCIELIQPQDVYRQLKQKIESFADRNRKPAPPARHTSQHHLCVI